MFKNTKTKMKPWFAFAVIFLVVESCSQSYGHKDQHLPASLDINHIFQKKQYVRSLFPDIPSTAIDSSDSSSYSKSSELSSESTSNSDNSETSLEGSNSAIVSHSGPVFTSWSTSGSAAGNNNPSNSKHKKLLDWLKKLLKETKTRNSIKFSHLTIVLEATIQEISLEGLENHPVGLIQLLVVLERLSSEGNFDSWGEIIYLLNLAVGLVSNPHKNFTAIDWINLIEEAISRKDCPNKLGLIKLLEAVLNKIHSREQHDLIGWVRFLFEKVQKLQSPGKGSDLTERLARLIEKIKDETRNSNTGTGAGNNNHLDAKHKKLLDWLKKLLKETKTRNSTKFSHLTSVLEETIQEISLKGLENHPVGLIQLLVILESLSSEGNFDSWGEIIYLLNLAVGLVSNAHKNLTAIDWINLIEEAISRKDCPNKLGLIKLLEAVLNKIHSREQHDLIGWVRLLFEKAQKLQSPGKGSDLTERLARLIEKIKDETRNSNTGTGAGNNNHLDAKHKKLLDWLKKLLKETKTRNSIKFSHLTSVLEETIQEISLQGLENHPVGLIQLLVVLESLSSEGNFDSWGEIIYLLNLAVGLVSNAHKNLTAIDWINLIEEAISRKDCPNKLGLIKLLEAVLNKIHSREQHDLIGWVRLLFEKAQKLQSPGKGSDLTERLARLIEKIKDETRNSNTGTGAGNNNHLDAKHKKLLDWLKKLLKETKTRNSTKFSHLTSVLEETIQEISLKGLENHPVGLIQLLVILESLSSEGNFDSWGEIIYLLNLAVGLVSNAHKNLTAIDWINLIEEAISRKDCPNKLGLIKLLEAVLNKIHSREQHDLIGWVRLLFEKAQKLQSPGKGSDLTERLARLIEKIKDETRNSNTGAGDINWGTSSGETIGWGDNTNNERRGRRNGEGSTGDIGWEGSSKGTTGWRGVNISGRGGRGRKNSSGKNVDISEGESSEESTRRGDNRRSEKGSAEKKYDRGESSEDGSISIGDGGKEARISGTENTNGSTQTRAEGNN